MATNETDNPQNKISPQTGGGDLPSFGEIFEFGWGVTKANFGLLIGTLLAVYAVGIIGNIVSGNIQESGSFVAGYGLQLIFWAVQVFLGIGVYRILLNLVDGQDAEFSLLFSGGDIFVPVFIAYVVFMIMFFIGFILLIIPGLYIAARFGLFMYAIVDKRLTWQDSLKASSDITEGRRLSYFIKMILIGLLGVAGVLALGIGLLVTVPLATVMMTYLYRRMEQTTAPTN